MKNMVRKLCALTFIISTIMSTSSTIYSQDRRVYIRFGDGTEQASSTGMRLKRGTDNQYWILASVANSSDPYGQSDGFAKVDPATFANPLAAHFYLNLGIPNTQNLGFSFDFAFADPINTAFAVGFQVFPPWQMQPSMNTIQFANTMFPVTGVKTNYNITGPLGAARWSIAKSTVFNRNPIANSLIVAFESAATAGGVDEPGVCSIDPNTGVLNWMTILSGAMGFSNVSVKDMIRDINGDYVICGSYSSQYASNRGMIAKVSAAGAIQWLRVYHQTNAVGVQVDSGLVFNSISMVTGGQGTEYIVSGSYHNYYTSGLSSILVASFSTAGNPNWAYEYHPSDNTPAFGNRHCITTDGSIAIAGKLEEPFPSSSKGTILKIKNYTYNNNLPCHDNQGGAMLFEKWQKYHQQSNSENTFMELVDIVPAINGNTSDVVTALGTAGVYHNSTLTADVVCMEKDLTASGGSTCISYDVSPSCNSISLGYTQPGPTPTGTATRSLISVSGGYDESWRNCSTVNTNWSLPKESQNAEQPVSGFYTYSNDVMISPLPNDGGVSTITISSMMPTEVSVSIADVSGRMVYSTTPSIIHAGKTQIPLDCKDLSAGMYAVTIRTGYMNKTILLPVIR